MLKLAASFDILQPMHQYVNLVKLLPVVMFRVRKSVCRGVLHGLANENVCEVRRRLYEFKCNVERRAPLYMRRLCGGVRTP